MKGDQDRNTEDRSIIRRGNLPHIGNRALHFIEPPHDKLKRTRTQMIGVSPGKKIHDRELLVIGTGRCGTTWLDKALNVSGIETGHECVRNRGAVSQYFHTDHDWYPFIPWATNYPGRKAHLGERRSDFQFDITIHLVRHPLLTEASMRGIFWLMNYFWMEDCGVLSVPYDFKPARLRNLHAWHDVVKKCEEVSNMTITLPQINTTRGWNRLISAANFDKVPLPDIAPTNKSSGFKKHKPLKWHEVDKLDRTLGKHLRKLCRKLRLE